MEGYLAVSSPCSMFLIVIIISVLLRQKRLCYWSALPELPLITLHYLSRWMLVTVLIVDVRTPYWTHS